LDRNQSHPIEDGQLQTLLIESLIGLSLVMS